MVDDAVKAAEEARRDRHWDAAAGWRALQEAIRWAARQATVRRNTPAACLARQRAKLARSRRAP